MLVWSKIFYIENINSEFLIKISPIPLHDLYPVQYNFTFEIPNSSNSKIVHSSNLFVDSITMIFMYTPYIKDCFNEKTDGFFQRDTCQVDRSSTRRPINAFVHA